MQNTSLPPPSSSFPSSSSSASDYSDDLLNLGVSPLLISLNGVRALFAVVGILLNASLVLVTVCTKSLHGSCNLLLALDSFGMCLYLASPLTAWAIALSGADFVPLGDCARLQFVPILGLCFSFGTMLFIAEERLLAITFPVWFARQKAHRYLPAMVLFAASVALFNACLLYASSTSSEAQSMMVACSVSDCYHGTAGQVIYSAGLVSILATIGCYLGIWTRMRKLLLQGKVDSTSRRLFKSLLVIVALITFGWLVDICARLVLPLFPLAPGVRLYTSILLSNCSVVASASNAPVLYAFSRDYHAAFNALINRTLSAVGLDKWRLHSTVGPTTVAAGAGLAAPKSGHRQQMAPVEQQSRRALSSSSVGPNRIVAWH